MIARRTTRILSHSSGVVFLFGWAALLEAQQPAKSQRLEIVDQSIDFHGGETFKNSESKVEVCSKSGCFKVRSRIDGGRFEIEASGRVRDQDRRVLITNDTLEYWKDGVAVDPVDADRQNSLRNWVMARAYFLFLPFRLNDDSVFKQDLGLERWADRVLRRIKISFAAGSSSGADDEYLYWFDPETARLEQFAYSFAGNPGGLRFRRAFNHRRVDGILFYDQENWGVDGDGLSVDSISPESVTSWERISTVTLREIEVEPFVP